MRHSITEPMPPKPTDGGRSASLGQRAAENESDPQAAAKKHASGKPDRARTKPPTYGEPALRKADERTGDAARRRFAPGACSEECEDANRCWTSSDSYVLNGLGMSDRRRRESSSWVLTSLRAVLLDIPASRASTSLSASASMLSTSSNARSIPCSGSTVSSMRSAPTWASHSLKGSAFGEGTDWMMRRTP